MLLPASSHVFQSKPYCICYSIQCLVIACTQTTVVLSILAAIMTAPINLLVDGLFEVISAPTLDQVKLQRQQQQAFDAVVAVGRRVSSAARRMSAAVVSRVQAVTAAIPVVERKKTFSERSASLMEAFVTHDISRDVSFDVQQAHALAKQFCVHSLKTRSQSVDVESPPGAEGADAIASADNAEVDFRRIMRIRIGNRQRIAARNRKLSDDKNMLEHFGTLRPWSPPKTVSDIRVHVADHPVRSSRSVSSCSDSEVNFAECEDLSDYEVLLLEMQEHYSSLNDPVEQKTFCSLWR